MCSEGAHCTKPPQCCCTALIAKSVCELRVWNAIFPDFFFHSAHRVCILTVPSVPMVPVHYKGISPTLETVSDVQENGLWRKGSLVSSRTQSNHPIKRSRAAAVPHSPVRNVKSGNKRESLGCEPLLTWRRVPTQVIRLDAGQMKHFDESL